MAVLKVGSYFDPPEFGGEELYDRFVVDQDITAAGTANLIDNFLYLDVAAAAQQQALDERSAFLPSLWQRMTVRRMPSLQRQPLRVLRLINDSTVEARYRYTNGDAQ